MIKKDAEARWRLRSWPRGLILQGMEENVFLEISTPSQVEEVVDVINGEPPRTEEVRQLLSVLACKQPGMVEKNERNCIDDNSPTLSFVRTTLFTGCPLVGDTYRIDRQKSSYVPFCHIYATEYTEPESGNREWTNGVSENLEIAEIKALMEAYERSSSGQVPSAVLITASGSRLEGALDPRKFVEYSIEQYLDKEFPFAQYDAGESLQWKEVVSVISGKRHYIPADLVYYPYGETGRKKLTQASSSGVSAHLGVEEALRSAILELNERHCFMETWLKRISPGQLSRKLILEAGISGFEGIEDHGYSIHFLDLTTTSSLPTLLVVAESPVEKPSLVLGMASALQLEIAAKKALAEVEQQLYWDNRYIEGYTKDRVFEDRDVATVMDHARLYAHPKHLARAEFLWQGSHVENLPEHWIRTSTREDLAGVVEFFCLQGKDIYYTELGTEGCPLKVVRAFIPGMIPISFGYNHEPLGMKVLKENLRNSHIHPFA